MGKYLVTDRYVIDDDMHPKAWEALSGTDEKRRPYFHDRIVTKLTDEEYEELVAEAEEYERYAQKAEEAYEAYLKQSAQA